MAKGDEKEFSAGGQIESLELQRAKLALERETMELEDAREQIEERRRRRESKKRTRELQEATLRQQHRDANERQRGCNHKKGGKGVNAVIHGQGSDANYAFVKHQYGHGQIWVLCQRCHAEWRPGDTAETHPTGISYAQALAFPTDNEMSTSCQFRFEKAPAA
jgi:hypothetical protein